MVDRPTRAAADWSPEDVADVLADAWGLRAGVRSLGSLQDAIFRVAEAHDEEQPLGAARVSTSAVDEAEVAAEARCLGHLAAAVPELDLPVLRPALDGALLTHRDGASVRLMRWVRGVPLSSWSRLPDQAADELGSVAGRVSRALRDLDVPAMRRVVDWDPRLAVRVVGDLLPRCPEHVAAPAQEALDRLRAVLPSPDSTDLPWQVVHLDVTDLNTLGAFAADGTVTATGLVDFEDMTWTWALCELAVTAHAAIGRRPEDPLQVLRHVVAGYRRHVTLTEADADLLWPLVLARATTCAVVEAVEVVDQPGNEYAARVARIDDAALRAVLRVPPTLAAAVVREACGFATSPLEPALPPEVGLVPVVASSGPGGHQVMADLTDAERDEVVPDAMHLGTVVHLDGPCDVVAPCAAEVLEATGSRVLLRLLGDGLEAHLRIDGLEPSSTAGAVVGAGDRLGRAVGDRDGEPTLLVQLLRDPSLPTRGAVRDAALWRRLCPDPARLLPGTARGLPAAADGDEVRQRRARHVAAIQKTYYRSAPLMVSGRGQWLVDSTGRRYLDTVNNVAVVGHSHPRVTTAGATQMALLGTNSRFLHDAIADYADKIVATLPAGLDTVLFVNSGSEAVELAVQLARAHTGRHDLVVMDGAYHGWTTGLLEACTLEGDRPGWRDKLAPWAHVADAPDTYRGAHGDDLAAYVRSVEDRCVDAAAHGGPAAFLAEAVLGNRGGVVPPEGYLAAAYDVVRRHGGLCIADEVQVGFARTGASFWAFEHQGAVPDVVACAKAAGNGHPLGFVVTRREVAESFAAVASFFSTPGGNPVSCRIGEAVLDVIADEGLQDNAARVGARISERLVELAERHPVIGATYGLGLYQGIDLVDGEPGSRAPMPDEDVADVCERMRELGVVAQPTGLLGNVLKIKPPLCLTEADADLFLDRLDQVLTEREELARLVQETRSAASAR